MSEDNRPEAHLTDDELATFIQTGEVPDVTTPPEVEPDPAIERAWAAERAAQRAVCDVPEDLPDDLARALELRVTAHLAAGTRFRPADPEARALEAPYSKRKPATGSV